MFNDFLNQDAGRQAEQTLSSAKVGRYEPQLAQLCGAGCHFNDRFDVKPLPSIVCSERQFSTPPGFATNVLDSRMALLTLPRLLTLPCITEFRCSPIIVVGNSQSLVLRETSSIQLGTTRSFGFHADLRSNERKYP